MFWIGLFLAGILLQGLGGVPLAMAIFPVPVAVLWVRGRHGAAAAAAVCGACSVLVGQTLMASAGDGVVLACAALAVAGLGAPLGEMIRRGRSFGQCVTLLAAVTYGLAVFEAAVQWDEFRKVWTIASNQFIAELEKSAGEANPVTELMRLVDVHLPYVFFGMQFTGVLLVVVLQVAAVFRWLRADPEAAAALPLAGKFQMMRPPETLVWLAIAAALLGLADYQWPNEVMRFVSWNTGVALAAVYWLNGVGIALCAMEAFGLRPPAAWGLLGLMMLIGLHNGLAVIGLFDTWFDQRLGVLRFAAAWRDRNRGDPKDPEA